MSTYAPAVAAGVLMPRVATGRGRRTLVSTGLAIAAAASAAVLLFRPWPVRNSFRYEQLAPVRDGIWTSILIDAVAFAVMAICLSIAVNAAIRSRGAALATIGGVVMTFAGVLFAMGSFAFATLTWYVTDTTALPTADGTRVLAYVVANPEHVLLPQMLGFLLFIVGTAVIAAALFRSGVVPRWLPLAIVAGTAAQFAFADRVLDYVQIVNMGLLIVAAWYLARAGAASPDEVARS